MFKRRSFRFCCRSRPSLLSLVNSWRYLHKFKCFITFSLLYSHIENETSSLMGNNSGYNCPQCGSRYCELPVECKQCGLTLVSAPHLARSYHHLFPIKPFIERTEVPEMTHCFACAKPFGELDPNVRMINVWFFRRFSYTCYYYYYFFLFKGLRV